MMQPEQAERVRAILEGARDRVEFKAVAMTPERYDDLIAAALVIIQDLSDRAPYKWSRRAATGLLSGLHEMERA